MDYSLLLGVHNQPVPTSGLPLTDSQGSEQGPAANTTFATVGQVARVVDVPRYYMGLIDILQQWNMRKRLERFAKIAFKGRWAKHVRQGMSAIEPHAYRERFLAAVGFQLGLPADDGSRAN